MLLPSPITTPRFGRSCEVVMRMLPLSCDSHCPFVPAAVITISSLTLNHTKNIVLPASPVFRSVRFVERLMHKSDTRERESSDFYISCICVRYDLEEREERSDMKRQSDVIGLIVKRKERRRGEQGHKGQQQGSASRLLLRREGGEVRLEGKISTFLYMCDFLRD